MMKKIFLYLLFMLFISSAFAQVHKWVDANGQTHYGDAPDNVDTATVSSPNQTPEEIAHGEMLRAETAKLKQQDLIQETQQAELQANKNATVSSYHCTTANGKESYSMKPCPKSSHVPFGGPVSGIDINGGVISGTVGGSIKQPVQQEIVSKSQACEIAKTKRQANYGNRKNPDFPTKKRTLRRSKCR